MKNVLNTVKCLTVAATAVTACGLFSTGAFAAGEPTIEEILDDIGAPESTVESGAELFRPLGGKNGMASGLLFEYAGFRNKNSVGVYNAKNPEETYELIGAKVDPGEQSLGDKWFGYNEIFKNFGETFEGIFGFYLKNHKGTFYSEASMNTGDVDHFKAFRGDGETKVENGFPNQTFEAHDWVIAFEDLPNGGDLDYNDFVAYVRQAEAVPEPTMLLGLAALVGGAVTLRRRSA